MSRQNNQLNSTLDMGSMHMRQVIFDSGFWYSENIQQCKVHDRFLGRRQHP